ncbi:alpha/beta hydrolase [Devosia sp. FJ2-5-3]|jgi:pimeloyl-ACP methyl ester carboxylesterase|uniref:alpha/beta fold hydrolase n=1 Tax=Devosia sp. FJ2-5-3 TaxID=2976680 RepID=UPI0023D81F8B|nr:alpha/beta hydrolase [Devosia sp. FJ2-5-3]WEJ56919.1 alpha/beta hydrolase [Devosia sp. FJ2-5-3]
MPLMIVFRFVFILLSLCILGLAAYLLWNWYDGDLIRRADGSLVRVRSDWLLWAGIALLALSFIGRPLVTLLLAKPDTDPTSAKRVSGTLVAGASGSSLYVEQQGSPDAPPIVLVHGWAMDSTIWFYAKRDLSRNFRIISWDLPGMGRSRPVSGSAIGLTEFAQDLKTVIGLAGDRKVVLVGHSIGGMTIQTLARDDAAFFNAHVAGTVLVNTTYTNPLKTMILSGLAQAIRWPLLEPLMRLGILLQPLVWLGAWQSYFSGSAHMANRLGFGKYVTRSQLEHTTLLATRNPPGNIHRGNLAMFRWDATGAMARVSPPLLVLSGELDIVTRPEAGEIIALDHKGADFRRIDGVNHMGFLERPSEYNAAIEGFALNAHAAASVI